MCEEEDFEQKPHIIIDNGTRNCKAGFSNEERPRAVFPSCLGYINYEKVTHAYNGKERFYIGDDAIRARGILKLRYLIEHGVINDWDDMEKIWGHVFTNELKVAPEEHNVMVTEILPNPRANRDKMAQIMFETFNVPNFYISLQPVLSLYSVGKFTGFVLDSRDWATHAVPIFDGFSLPHAIMSLDIAGKELTEYMRRLLNEKGYKFTTDREKEIAKKIKEQCIYIPFDFEEESNIVKPYEYELPDGNIVIVKDQRIRCPEALFNPRLIGKEGPGIANLCYDSIQKCDIDLRKELYNNIFLYGGNTMINGLSERLTKEIKNLLGGPLSEVQVLPLENNYNKYAVWKGGVVASNLEQFKSQWISKDEYEENGATIVHRKCF